MASFADEVDGVFHLGPPVMPAQEFYKAAETQDPTFELAYWWFALELAQRFRERRGMGRKPEWDRVQAGLARPSLDGEHYAAVAGGGASRTDDHPSMLLALGFVPPTPLIDPGVMRTTLDWVLGAWEWDSAWGWDYATMLSAVSLMVAGWDGGPGAPGIPDDGTWRVAHEGLVAWP